LRIAALDGSAMAPAERPRVDVSWYDFTDAQAPRYGECWTGRAKVKVQPRRGGVHLEIDGRDARYVSGDHGWAMAAWCFRARRAAARYLTMGIEDFGDIKGLLLSLLLGYRGAFPIEARQAFVATGTLHIFAISGSHVAIVTLLGMTALKAARVPRRAWVFVLAPLLAVYAVGTGARSSAVRACLMAATYVAAPALGRRPDGLSSIALAALLILVAVPGQAMDVGFLLSFVVVLVLMILYPRLERVWRPWVEPDPLRVAPENVWRVRGRHVCRYILSLVALSGCATVGSIPLMAYYFEQFTPIGILANVWVVPLAYLIVLAGGLALLLGPIAGVLAVIFNHANLALMAAMAGGMPVRARVPVACCHVPRPPAWSVWLWYAALAALVLAVDRRTRDARADSAPGAPLF
jgi:competence protein ComEC